MLLKMQVSYTLHGLRSVPMPTRIEHFLDWHFKIKDHNLPCFSEIKVDSKDIPLDSTAFNKQGEFSYVVEIPAKDKGMVWVATSRQEVVYFPGTNCFVLNEITKGIEICLTKLPEDVAAFVTIRPHKNLKYRELRLDSTDNPINIDDVIFFPGQIIELLFQPKSQPSVASPVIL